MTAQTRPMAAVCWVTDWFTENRGMITGLAAYLALYQISHDWFDSDITAALTVAILLTAVMLWEPFDKAARSVALAFAIWSHGPVDGVTRDRCFPARANHFLHWIRTGDNLGTPEPAENP